MDINLVVKISARAWSLPILAALHRGVPGRQAALLSVTKAGRTAFGQSLKHLLELGLMERNPGHGHPLRPEYRLTATGVKAAAMADEIESASPQTAQNSLLRRAWTLPILAVSAQPKFFSEIKSDLPAITDRALSQSLKKLQSANWLARRVDPHVHPLRPQYQAANAGASISQAVRLRA